jgi:hypothetical protein
VIENILFGYVKVPNTIDKVMHPAEEAFAKDKAQYCFRIVVMEHRKERIKYDTILSPQQQCKGHGNGGEV